MTKATPNYDFGGYDYQFVHPPPDTLICKICHCPSKEPHLSVCCGHTFCKSCLTGAKFAATTKFCHVCRSTKFQTFPNKQNERLIKSLIVFCTNKGKGCEWQGEVNDIKTHLSGCQFQDVRCLNNCGLSVQRQHMSKHTENDCPYRTVNCQYCSTSGKHQFIDNQHKTVCLKFPIPCPNECGMTIPREDINEHKQSSCLCQMLRCFNMCGATYQRKDQSTHIAECPRRKVSCPYCEIVLEYRMVKQHNELCPKFPLTCPNKCKETRIPREDLDEHRKNCPLELVRCSNECGEEMQRQDQTNHIEHQCPRRKITCQFCDIVGEYQFITHEHKQQCPRFPLVCPNRCNNATKILRKNMQAHRSFCPLEIIQCEFHGVGCKTKLVRRESRKHYQYKVMEYLLFTKSELISTKSKLENAEKKMAAIEKNTDALLAKFQQKIDKVVATADMKQRELETRLQQSDWLKTLHSRVAASMSGNNYLPVTIKMTGYSGKKWKNDNWESRPFCSRDYKLQLLVHPNLTYSGRGSYMGVQLKWVDPYRPRASYNYYYDEYEYDRTNTSKFKVQLLNQICDNEHYSQSHKATLHEAAWYNDEYISTNALHRNTATCQYLKNDTIFFAVYET